MVSHSHPKPAPIPHQRLRRFLLGALIAFALGLPYAHATDWARMARLAPPDADIFIVIERAGEVRRGAAGPTLSEIFASALPLTSASQAWRTLADGVGRPSEKAFDALLGARVMFIGRSGPGPMQWALVSEVDARVARRLLTSLGAKPAMIKAGRPIAEIEDGRFRVSARLRGASTTLVFAPASNDALFDDLLARLDAPQGASLARDADLAAATAALPADAHAFLFFRAQRTQDKADDEDLPDWVAWSVTVDSMRIITEMAASGVTLESPEPVVSRGSWRAASKDAILAILEPVEHHLLPLASLFRRFSFSLDNLLLPIRGRIGLFVTQPTPSRVALAVVAETPAVEKLAPVGDAFMGRIASGIAPGSAGGLRMLDGLFPATRRRVDLPLVGDFGARLRRTGLATDHFSLIWSYPADAPEPSGRPGAGWWIIASDEALHDRLAKALAHAEPGAVAEANPEPEFAAQASAPLSLMIARPRALLEALRRAGMTPEDEPPLFRGFSLIDTIEGESRLKDGMLLGRAVVTLLAPPAPADHAAKHRDR